MKPESKPMDGGLKEDMTREEYIEFIKSIPKWNSRYEVSNFMANNRILDLEDEVKRLTRPTPSMTACDQCVEVCKATHPRKECALQNNMTTEEREKVVGVMVKSCESSNIRPVIKGAFARRMLAAIEAEYEIRRKI